MQLYLQDNYLIVLRRVEACGLNFCVCLTFSQASKNIVASTALRGRFGSTLVPHLGGNQGDQRAKPERGMNLNVES